jgi:hypothetical protein
MPNLHLVDRYFQAVKTLGVVNDVKTILFLFLQKMKLTLKNNLI